MLRKSLTKDLLIFLGFLIDEIDAHTYHAQMQRLFCQGWYKRSSFESSVRRLLSVGDIEKIQKGGNVFYRLTSLGSERIKENIPIVRLASKPWDKKWRLVIFDIQEKNKSTREALRDKLISLGFGMWQESVYITPFDIEQEINQYLVSKKLSQEAVCLVAQRSDLGDDRALANYVWKLGKLNEEYRDFFEDCQRVREKRGDKITEVQRLWLAYQDLIFKDPHLPKELLPVDWLGERERARREFSRLIRNY
ncbi:MAG: CRISPR-associated endonuclease Cas2 [Patescibacteria group bacterium]